MTTIAPTHGTAHADRTHMPVYGYVLIMLAALTIALLAAWVSREYALSNLSLMALPEYARKVREHAVDIMLTSGLALFLFAASVPREKFKPLRNKLLALGFSIWAFGCLHTYQARISITMTNTSASTASTQSASELRESIKSERATAAALRESAAGQANSKFPASRADGSASLRAAADADKRADEKAAQLAQIEHSKPPEEAAVWKEWTNYKMAAESLLIGLIEWVMLMLAGEMLRAARDAHALKQGSRSALTFGKPSPVPVPFSKAPSPAQAKPVPAPKSWFERMADSIRKPGWKQAAMVPAAAGTAAGAGAQPPALPEPAPISMRYVIEDAPAAPSLTPKAKADAPSEPTQPTVLTSAQPNAETVPESAQSAPPAKAATVPESAQLSAPKQAQSQAAPSAETKAPVAKAKRARRPAATAVADGAKIDTGTEGKAAARYERVKAAVLAGKLKPSVRAIQGTEGGSTLIARRYLQQLDNEGVIERNGQGWTRASSSKEQMSLV